jgi:dTDP-4-dehydrorhamnose reductase
MAPRRIAIVGRHGQVARALAEAGEAAGLGIITAARPELDLARVETIAPALRSIRPDAVVCAAAYTAGDKLAPYVEDDPVGPLGVYGASKLAGERAVAAAGPDHVILRTAWVYSPFGTNFVKTMLRLAADRDVVRVVADQWGCPTSALDLAPAVLRVIDNLLASPGERRLRGVFHLAGRGETSWAGFATAVFAASRRRGGPWARVENITTAEYPTAARRPARSCLDGRRIEAVHGVALGEWQAALETCMDRLLEPSLKT